MAASDGARNWAAAPPGAPERVTYIAEVALQGGPFAVAPANFLDWSERRGSFEAMGVIAGGAALVTEGGPAERVAGVRARRTTLGRSGWSPRSVACSVRRRGVACRWWALRRTSPT